MIENLLKRDDRLHSEFLESRLSKQQIKKYDCAMMSEYKMRLLSELREHYEFYGFIPFENFERMKEDQLEDMLKLTLAFADEEITRTALVKKVDQILEEQNSVLKNRDLKKLLSRYLPEEYIPYVYEMSIGFLNIHESNVAACFNIIEPKTYYQIEDSIYKELMMLPKEFLSDKPGLNIELYADKEDKYPLAVFKVDYEESDIACDVDYRNLLYALRFNPNVPTFDKLKAYAETVVCDEMDVREQYEQLQDIKKDWIKSKDDVKMIQDLDQYLEQIQDRDAIAIRHRILDKDELDGLLLASAKEGADKVIYMLYGYEPYMSYDYVYRTETGGIKNLEFRDIKKVFDSLEQLDRFQEVQTLEHSIQHMKEVTDKEKEDLIAVCQKNDVLKYGKSFWSEEKILDTTIEYHFLECEKRLDVRNYFRQYHPIREGVIFEGMAFIQMDDTRDFYHFMKRDEGQWFSLGGVQMKDVLKRGNFFGDLENMNNDSIKAIERKRKQEQKQRTKGGKDDRNR